MRLWIISVCIKKYQQWTGCKREGQVGGFGAMDRVAVKLEQDLVPMDEGNGEKQLRSRSMNQYGHMMI